MFWGLILKANRKYTQTIKQAFHLSQAALDISNSSDEPVQVVLTSDSHNYILCTLRKGKVEQVALDLSFAEGDEISFISQGNGNVHLSGYLMLDEDDLDLMGDEESESEGILNHLPQKKQKKLSKEEQKKAALQDDDDEDDEDEDESLLNGSAEESDEEEDEEEEDDEEDEDDSDSAEEVEEPKPKQMKLDKGKQNLGNGKAVPKEKTKKEKKKEQQKPQQQQQNKSPKSAGEKTIQGGVKIEDIKVGAGNEAKPGKKVQVSYEGKLKSNNKVFDSSKGAGFKFNLGKGEVIKGWDVGLAGMKVGGKRRITCPPHMAYGQKGSPPVIPPNSTLVFEVELKNVF